ncbi:hypothetical protein A5742_12730 [Mycolicibacterium fortuitum]|uniref:Uncharacterized protein n=1 Tax=Mycolicibacterium fortuitum TaxID=1766 RepID=A0ABD6QDP1_MYCFO|nr:hypothetical protein A5742_12730 [Mycolicibacterium fortuitum]
MFEEGRPGHATVVGTHDARPDVGGELLPVPVPRRPTRGIGIHQYEHICGVHRRLIRPGRQCVQPVDPHQPRIEAQPLEVATLHPADRKVQGAVGHPGGLGMRGHHPGVHPHLRDTGGPLRPIGRAPLDIADPHRFGHRQTLCSSAQFVCLLDQIPRPGQQRGTGLGQRHRAPVAIEQLHLEIAFQRLDLLGQRRTGDTQPLCRAAEVQFLGDGDEVAQLPQLHPRSLLGRTSQQ